MTVEYHGNNRVALIDDTTKLWCGRMLIGEGWKNGKGEAVLWSTLYRFLGMPHKWKSYLEMIRLFSQPINSRWLPGGDMFDKYKENSNPVYQKATSDKAVERRTRIQSTTWDELPKGVQTIVEQFSTGSLLPPPKFGNKKYSNFASYNGVQKSHPGGIDIGGDWFFIDPNIKTDWEISIAEASPQDGYDDEKKNRSPMTKGLPSV